MLLFIGFNRLWHFTYIRLDAIVCGFFQLTRLPVASTFWRYLDSMGINQAQSLLKLMSLLRERVWQQLDLSYSRICVDIDTTVATGFNVTGGGTVTELREEHRLAGLEPQGRSVGGRRPVDTEADMNAGTSQRDHRSDARRQDQVARRAVGDADPGGAGQDVRAPRRVHRECLRF